MKKVTYIVGGKNHVVEYEEGDSLLDCALKHDLNPPYSCMEGVCSACKAKVLQGKVDFPDDTILDEADVSGGYILTCQAKLDHDSNDVVISYDAN